jgi:hypothetical protein
MLRLAFDTPNGTREADASNGRNPRQSSTKLKPASESAENQHMFRPRKELCIALAMGALVAPALSGCANVGAPGAAAAQAGVVGEVFEQLKREDDEAEVNELDTLREVRQQQHEQAQEEEVEWR